MALHLVFPTLRPMAPLSDDLFFFSSRLIPPNLISGVYLSSRRGRQFLPTLSRRVGWIGLNGLLCSLYRIALCTYKNGDFGAISVT